MIAIDNISFAYDQKEVFNNYSMQIKDGERICLFGESGKGKTTLLRIISGLEKPQKGNVETEGAVFSAVFQENRLLPFKTALENITLICGDSKTALKHLTALKLADAANKYPRELSGGMCRRVAIARALSARYNVLILDEPFSGLDRENTENAAAYILKCLENRTLVAVTHSYEEARLLGAEIIKI